MLHELRPGLWHWRAAHPEWQSRAPFEHEVSSYALDDGANLLLFDPLAPPDELLTLAAERRPAIVLTAPWHERDARSLTERLGASIYTPPADTAGDLMRKYNATADEVGEGSPDLDWLRAGGGAAHWLAAGDRLPFGIEVFAGYEHNDLALWLESRRVLVAGDLLSGLLDERALRYKFLGGRASRDTLAEALRPLLELPVEMVLPAHGAPTDRGALERALA